VSCLGVFLGLRCIIKASYYQGSARAWWLACAAGAIGATGIWAMHFIAMLGFSIPGKVITYDVPITIASLLIAVAFVYVGLVIVSYSEPSRARLLAAGLVIGVGSTVMHYLGMNGMMMPYATSYSPLLGIVSLAISIAAGTIVLWLSTRVRSIPATLGASLVTGVAVSAMHYTGMASMRVQSAPMQMTAGGASGTAFLMPLLVGIALVSFVLALIISLAPSEAEMRADVEFSRTLKALEHRSF